MSGDGTTDGKSGSRADWEDPTRHNQNNPDRSPLAENPNDPNHYYKGTDGQYYYTPDGNPHPEGGQPKAMGTEPLSNYRQKYKPDTGGTWKHEADKVYKMHPDGLRNLAKQFDHDLAELKNLVQNKVQAGISGAAGAMGKGYDTAADYDKLVGSSAIVFTQQYNALIAIYESLISLLKTTAENGQNGEDATVSNVNRTGIQADDHSVGSDRTV